MPFLVIVTAVLSISQILRYYFSYEDFSLLYGVQFPDDSHSIFLYPGFVAYRFLRYMLVPQFFLFKYQSLGYYFISFSLFLLFLLLFYRFIRIFYPPKKNIALFATLIAASGYIGIEALTWNVAGGQVHLTLLVVSLLTLSYAILFLRNKKIFDLMILTFASAIAVYFFQFRSYLLIFWVSFLIFFKAIEDRKKPSPRILAGVVILLIFLISLFSQSIKLVLGRVEHVNLDALSLISVFLQNLGNIFFPSDLFTSLASIPLLGIFALIILILPPVYLVFHRRQTSLVLAFFSLSILTSLVVIMMVTAFIGQVPTVWPSSHRFYIVLLPFISGYLAILISLFRPIVQVPIIVIIVLTHIWFSNKVIGDRWNDLSRHLGYFYTGVTALVPRIDKPSVFLITLSRPIPPGPFVSGSDAGSGHYLAGFYGKRLKDFLFATTPLEAVKLLVDNKLTKNDIYAFDYKRDDLVDETQEARDILTSGKRLVLAQGVKGSIVEFNNLNIKSTTPIFLKIRAGIAILQDNGKAQALRGGSMSKEKYFELFFDQEEKRTKMDVSSESKPLGEEHVLSNVVDGKYDTTWIPQEWGPRGVSVTINLREKRKVRQVVWSSSRTATWPFRSPSEYEIAVSANGTDFKTVSEVDSAPSLKSGQFFTNIFEEEAQYIRFTIKKTHGGWTPAIDEIEVFDKPNDGQDLENYFLVKNNPSVYFPNEGIASRFYQQILKQKVPVEINWRTDNDGDYLAGQEKKIYIKGIGNPKEYLVLLPKTGRVIKSLRIKTVDFPSELRINKFEVWQPSLEDFRTNKDLWVIE